MATYTGDRSMTGGRFALVAARFNSLIVDRLVEGASAALTAHGVHPEDIDTVNVPGSLELPLVARRLAESGQYSAVIALGCIIKGDTDHYDVVVQQSARGIADASLKTNVPILNSILTTHDLEQALHRAGGKAGNKGYDVAVAAIEMTSLLKKLPGAGS